MFYNENCTVIVGKAERRFHTRSDIRYRISNKDIEQKDLVNKKYIFGKGKHTIIPYKILLYNELCTV